LRFGKYPRQIFSKIFNRIKIGGAGASISCTAFEKVGHFSIIPKSKSSAPNGNIIFERIIPKRRS